MDMAGLNGTAERRPRCQQAALADHLVNGARTHAFGQWTQGVAGEVGADQVGCARGRISATCHDCEAHGKGNRDTIAKWGVGCFTGSR